MTIANDLLVGRDAEQSALRAALDERGGLVLVSGEAGVGKSRLVADAAANARKEGRAVLWGRPEQVARPGPFALVVDLVENIAAGAASPSVAADAQALSDSLMEPQPGGAGVAARRAAARLRGLLAQAGSRPVAIFEDLHVADEASHAIIVHLARSAQDDECHIVATFRSDEIGAADELERFLDVVAKERLAQHVRLTPLPREAVRALAGAILGDHVTEGQLEWIAAQSDGVPFFVEELAAAYLESQSMSGVPENVGRAVVARVARLGAVARTVVRTAALVTGPIDPKVLAFALEMDPSAVSRALTEAARGGLVQDRDGRLMFRHALVRESVKGDLVSVEAEESHRRLAQAIEQTHGDTLGPHAKALARHWYEGRDRERAFAYALEAGERALSLAATGEARLAYELAVACHDVASPQALVGLAEVDVREAKMTGAEESFLRASEMFADSGRIVDAARALLRAAWINAIERRYDRAFDALDAALALIPPGEYLAERAAILTQKGRLARGSRDEERALALREAMEIADRLDDQATRAEALEAQAWEAYREHRADEAIDLAERACKASMAVDRIEILGRCHNNGALIHSGCGNPVRGLELLATARERLSQSFGSFGVAFIDTTEALLRFRMGEAGNVLRLVARLDVGWTTSRGTVRMLQAWAFVHSGERERAQAVCAQAREDVPAGEEVTDAGIESALTEALVWLETGDESIVPRPEDLLAFDWSHAIADDQALAMTLAARMLTVQGDLSAAQEALGRLDDLLSRFQARHVAAAAQEVRGMILLAQGNRSAASERFASAAQIWGDYPNRVDAARVMRLLAGTFEESAKTEKIEMLKQAAELAQEAGSSFEVGRIESDLRALGVRPRAGRPRKKAGDLSLSARELEVATLVAAGASNAAIASRLFLSQRTVQDHITHALRKLSLTGRAGLAAWAARQGLI